MNLKIALLCLTFLLLGAGGLYAYMQYQQLQAENLTLKQAVPAPTATTTTQSNEEILATATPAMTALPTPVAQKSGAISGKLGYPSEGIPPLQVYAQLQSDPSQFYMVTTAQNESVYTITAVPPGTYVVFAYPQNSSTYAGGYSQMVPCGLLASCTDHSLIPVVVQADKTATGVDIQDWYAPENTFPKKPNL